MHRAPWLTAIILFLAVSEQPARAQVQFERFFPPAVARGATTSIKAEGKFPQWPVAIECDQSDLKLECGEKPGELKVTAADSTVGAAWIRLHDSASASSLIPLLIESSAITAEAEPNEGLRQATPATLPTTAVGRLEKNGDVDMWKVTLREGDQMFASVIAHEMLQSPMDAVLQLVDRRGLVLAQAEDSIGLDPQLIYTAKQDGDYFVRVFSFPETPTGTIGFAGGASFVYALRLATGPLLDHVFPLHKFAENKLSAQSYGWNLPADLPILTKPQTSISPETIYSPQAIGWQWLPPAPIIQTADQILTQASEQTVAPESAFALPLAFYGHISSDKEVDRLRVKAIAGVNYRVEIVSRALGFKLDSVLRVLKSDSQTQLARNDDAVRNQFDAAVEFKTEQDEEVVIEISDLADSSGPRHAYACFVSVVKPQFIANVAADHFQLQVGKPLEIPITVARQSGDSNRIEFDVKLLPPGVTVTKIISEPKGDTSKAIKLNLVASTDAMPYQGPIEIIATAVDDKQTLIAEPQLVTFSLRPQIPLSKLWLTIAK